MKNRVSLIIFFIYFFLLNSIVFSMTYNATEDYSVSSNSNGVWSYGWMQSNLDVNTFSLFTNTITSFWLQWYTPGLSSDCTPCIAYNNRTTTNYGVAPGQLSIHPGPAQQASVLRFTAPTDGDYNFAGQFMPGDSGTMQVGIRNSSAWLWQATNSGSFNINQTITAGTSVDFFVYGGYGAGNTPISLEVTGPDPVPEASTCLALSIALGLFTYFFKKKLI